MHAEFLSRANRARREVLRDLVKMRIVSDAALLKFVWPKRIPTILHDHPGI